MKDFTKEIIKSFLPRRLYLLIQKKYQKKQVKDWRNNNYPDPPPHLIKQIAIQDYQKRYGYNIFIETGTFMGDMVEAQRKKFGKIISVELSVKLFEKAKKTFRQYDHITILNGDSGRILPEIMENINESAIFWLDGHYSGGITARGIKSCPIIEELSSIINQNQTLNHVILIDDARSYKGEGDYPEIDTLTAFVKSKNDKYQVEVKDDIIRYTI